MSDAALRFPADESCYFGVVKALRAKGYDVVALTEITSRTIDSEVVALSYSEKRILLTEDKDFGQLVFASQADSAGVILIRYPGNARKLLQEAIIKLVREQGTEIQSAFVVMQPGQIRMRLNK
jgi:predicted nuclease of predicted toxin-antitoxin system